MCENVTKCQFPSRNAAILYGLSPFSEILYGLSPFSYVPGSPPRGQPSSRSATHHSIRNALGPAPGTGSNTTLNSPRLAEWGLVRFHRQYYFWTLFLRKCFGGIICVTSFGGFPRGLWRPYRISEVFLEENECWDKQSFLRLVSGDLAVLSMWTAQVSWTIFLSLSLSLD